MRILKVLAKAKLAVLALLISGCIGGMDKHGAKIKKMYPDQITIDTVLPKNAPSISQQFHRFKNPLLNESRSEHLGIDIIAPKGASVIAASNGTVVQSNFHPMYGNTIEVNHGKDAKGRQVRTIYKHLNSRALVVGERVTRGQMIGGLGRTGVLSSGILHMHFEVRRTIASGRAIAVDPGEFWVKGMGQVSCFDSAKHWPKSAVRFTYPVVCKDI
ncbi:MAG: murein DD-endopeptidase MepM/ murein hydrolase activator NlpD [Paracoccaceae bacterium]|jgi:murein DD-endopeptidase MepM/ murein hydrolase activator NlpD